MKDGSNIKVTPIGNGQTVTDWNISTQVISKSGNVIVVENCFGYMFTNIGDTVCRVNGMVVFPSATPATSLGDSRTISAHELEIYTGTIEVAFTPGGANPQVEIVQQYYKRNYSHQ